MQLRIGIENNNDDRTIAWALEHPGCFAYGRDSREAQANFLQAARDYAAWIGRHETSWLEPDAMEISVEETFDAYFIDSAFELAQRGRIHPWSNHSSVMTGSPSRLQTSGMP